MNPGIEKDQVLWMMAEMVKELEKSEPILQDSMVDLRADLINQHLESLNELTIHIDQLTDRPKFRERSEHPSELMVELGF